MHLSRIEQETVISFNEEEQIAGIYTHNRALLKKLSALAESKPELCKVERVSCDGAAADFIVPKNWIKVAPPRKMNLTDEQRAALAARLKGRI